MLNKLYFLIKTIKYSEELGNFAILGLPKKSKNYQNLLKYKTEEFIQKHSESLFNNKNTSISFNEIENLSKENAEKWIFKEKISNIQRLLEIKYGREIKEEEKIISNGNKKISPNQLAVLEMDENEGEKWMKLREYPKIQFDLLLCAGGVNDRIRTELLGFILIIKIIK